MSIPMRFIMQLACFTINNGNYLISRSNNYQAVTYTYLYVRSIGNV